MTLPYYTLADFLKAYDKMERPLAILAHQDDEVPFGGTLARAGDRARIVWVTNGDGLYFQTDMEPARYATIRKAEALKSAAALGIAAERTECLDFSEVEIYRRLSYVTQSTDAVLRLRPFFQRLVDAIRDRLFAYRPQVVFTPAYQGGNPEHDLTHYFTRLALDDYENRTGEQVPLLHVPMYEYVILVALRFNPFYGGLRWRHHLSEDELRAKRQMLEAYPSQINLFRGFEKIAGAAGKLSVLTGGKALSVEQYLAQEEFGPVPENWDYLKNPHTFDRANYIGDHFAGIPVSFAKSIRPIVAAFPRAS